MVKKLIFAGMALVIIAFGAVGLAYHHLMSWAEQPKTVPGKEKLFTIPTGQGLRQTSRALEQEGLISNALRFTILVRLEKQDKRLQAGEYFLSTAMTPKQILGQLVKGRVHLYRVTVPEGFNLVQIASAVADAGLAPEADFLAATRDPQIAKDLGIDAETVEGYLFPDTYYFPSGMQSKTIIATMVKQFQSAFSPEWKTRAKALGMRVHEVVTLASIIEKETGAPEERPLISSVFHNRLKKGMRLETDPTVIYGIPDFDGNIKRRHLETYTPYNTYKIKGLPPGPIASPGKAAMQAALYPAQSDYLYFVSKKDGTHQFSATIKEHNAAVRKYQLRKRR